MEDTSRLNFLQESVRQIPTTSLPGTALPLNSRNPSRRRPGYISNTCCRTIRNIQLPIIRRECSCFTRAARRKPARYWPRGLK